MPNGATQAFFETELPELAVEKLLDRDEEPRFQSLVVDEAQDILREPYLDYLDLLIEGGLASGEWTMFGDFERQALFDAADVSLESFLDTRTQAFVFGLRTNCRNTPRVARWVSMLAALDPAYSRIRRPDTGPPPRTRYYSDDADQASKLAHLLQDISDAGFEGRDIVILSTLKDGAAGGLDKAPWRDRLKPYTFEPRGNHIRFTTVQAFKGLEAPVIVLTDVKEIQGDRARSVFYTATTRATERLYILADDTLADEMLDLIDRFEPEEDPGE